MNTENNGTNQSTPSRGPRQLQEVSQHVAGAHGSLRSLRERLNREQQSHPELEDSIAKLEAALNLLTVQTGGTL